MFCCALLSYGRNVCHFAILWFLLMFVKHARWCYELGWCYYFVLCSNFAAARALLARCQTSFVQCATICVDRNVFCVFLCCDCCLWVELVVSTSPPSGNQVGGSPPAANPATFVFRYLSCMQGRHSETFSRLALEFSTCFVISFRF